LPKLLIATPAHGEVFYTPYVDSIFRLHRALPPVGWTLSFASISYADIAESRNFLLTHFFDKTDASHILFVDVDMGFEPQLVQEMIALNKPVVGAIAPRRAIDLKRLARIASEGTESEQAINRAHDYVVQTARGRNAGRKKGFIEVDGVGAGVLLIQRGAIDQMLKKMPSLSDKGAPKHSPLARGLDRLIRAFDPITTDIGRLSEDFSFCHRWRVDCGGEIWASTNRTITHVGLHHYAGRYGDAAAPRILIGGKTAPDARAAARAGVGQGAAARGKGAMVTARKPVTLTKGATPKGKPVKH